MYNTSLPTKETVAKVGTSDSWEHFVTYVTKFQ
jgi:hypothetical protein